MNYENKGIFKEVKSVIDEQIEICESVPNDPYKEYQRKSQILSS